MTSELDRCTAFRREPFGCSDERRSAVLKEAVRWEQNDGFRKAAAEQVSHPAHEDARETSELALRRDSG